MKWENKFFKHLTFSPPNCQGILADNRLGFLTISQLKADPDSRKVTHQVRDDFYTSLKERTICQKVMPVMLQKFQIPSCVFYKIICAKAKQPLQLKLCRNNIAVNLQRKPCLTLYVLLFVRCVQQILLGLCLWDFTF